MNQSNFLKLECPRCMSHQITFGKATMTVKCKSCNKLLVQPRGGKAKVKAKVKEVVSA